MSEKIFFSSHKTQLIFEALKQSVTKALDKKRRLGHYSVIWQDGKPILQGDDAPQGSNSEVQR